MHVGLVRVKVLDAGLFTGSVSSARSSRVSMVTRHEEAAVPEEKRSWRSCALTRWRPRYRDTE